MKFQPEIDWLIHCDATSETGLGHLARCLGYAEALTEIGQSVCFVGAYHDLAEAMIANAGIDMRNVALTENDRLKAIFQESGSKPVKGVLLDRYTLSTKDLRYVKTYFPTERIVLIDDFGDRPKYVCDTVINFTINAETLTYDSRLKTFLGTVYYPARTWLRAARKQRYTERKEKSQELKKWLIICGGTDHLHITVRLLNTLTICLPSADIKVMRALGVDEDEFQKAIGCFNQAEIIEPRPELKDLFVWADACLCGGGLTKYECAFAGLPVASFAQTSGQQADTVALVKQGIAADLGAAYSNPDILPIAAFNNFLNDQNNLSNAIERGQVTIGSDDISKTLEPFIS